LNSNGELLIFLYDEQGSGGPDFSVYLDRNAIATGFDFPKAESSACRRCGVIFSLPGAGVKNDDGIRNGRAGIRCNHAGPNSCTKQNRAGKQGNSKD
jgi:hypothetical protein